MGPVVNVGRVRAANLEPLSVLHSSSLARGKKRMRRLFSLLLLLSVVIDPSVKKREKEREKTIVLTGQRSTN